MISLLQNIYILILAIIIVIIMFDEFYILYLALL